MIPLLTDTYTHTQTHTHTHRHIHTHTDTYTHTQMIPLLTDSQSPATTPSKSI